MLRLRKRLRSTITDSSVCLGRGVLLCKLFNARSLRNKLSSLRLTSSSSLNHDFIQICLILFYCLVLCIIDLENI